MCWQGINEEIELKMGKEITLTTDDQYKEKVDEDFIWVDYKNIVNVVEPGSEIYIDDGLLSLIVKDKGRSWEVRKDKLR